MNITPRSKLFVEIAGDLLSRGYRVRFRADGVSMHPTIRGGETITVEPVSDISIGDIILYRAERGLIAHRVARIQKENGKPSVFLTRGDARGSTDEAVDEQHVFGKVLAVERKGRSIDLGGRLARIRSRARSGLLLVFALIAMFPSAVRASIAVTAKAFVAAPSGTTCTITGLDSSTGGPNMILVSVSGTNAATFNTPTISPSGGTITLIFSSNGSGNVDTGVWSITGFTHSTTTSIQIVQSGPTGRHAVPTHFRGSHRLDRSPMRAVAQRRRRSRSQAQELEEWFSTHCR